MRRQRLEMILSGLADLESPDPRLEQYNTPTEMAVEMLHFADSLGDIRGKRIAELGCGRAPFAIGAYLMGAGSVWGCDSDRRMVDLAWRNFSKVRGLPGGEHHPVHCRFEEVDVAGDDGSFPTVDTVFMNPPFGAQKKGADRPFIDRSLSMGDIVHSIHNGPSLDFLKGYLGERGAVITHVWRAPMEIARRFDFHRKERKEIEVLAVRFQTGRSGRATAFHGKVKYHPSP